jgi:hypothetical protein
MFIVYTGVVNMFEALEELMCEEIVMPDNW